MALDDFLERQFPGTAQSLKCLRPLMIELSQVASLRTVGNVLKLWSRLQRLSGDPYPPLKGARLITDRTEEGLADVVRLNRFCRYAISSYAPFGNHSLTTNIQALPNGDTRMESMLLYHDSTLEIIEAEPSTHDMCPAHILFYTRKYNEVVMTIRGSIEIADWIINFTCAPTEDGYHSGMMAAARALDNATFAQIAQAIEEHPGCKLRFTGHSLGGGIASLLTILWCNPTRSQIMPRRKLHGFSYGSPCVVSWQQSEEYTDVITSAIVGRDIVARLSTGTMRQVTGTLKFLSNAIDHPPLKPGSPKKGFCSCTQQPFDADEEILPIPLKEALALSKPYVITQVEKGSPMHSKYTKSGFQFDMDELDDHHHHLNPIRRHSSRGLSTPTKRSEEEILAILHRCHAVFQNQADFEHHVDLVPAGRILQLIPRLHATLYRVPYTNADINNDNLIFEMPSCRGPQAFPLMHLESVSDHFMDKYVMAFCPELMSGVPEGFVP